MIMSGPDDGSILDLNSPKQGDAYLIGRREDCDVILPYDSQISRQHARLLNKDGQWFVQDLGSRNGTHVGKQKIDAITALEPEQMFRVGRTWIRLMKREG
jgi:pSer/pThr/pTyr-binding forkhead associated (FHA) protein